MKKGIKIFFGVLLIMIAIVALNSFYVVGENEHACVVRFSKIDTVTSEAGIYFKLPFVDNVNYYPKNIQLYDMKPSDVILLDKKTMQIDSYVMWKIIDPKEFYKTINSIPEAETRIEALTYNSTNNKFGGLNQEDVINESPAEKRNALYEEITLLIRENTKQYGIEVIDVKVKCIDLPIQNEQAVYARMISERNQTAAAYVAEGELDAAQIINEADKKYNTKINDAKLNSERIIAEGEKEYMRILSTAYNTDDKKAFYEFIRGLDALKASLNGSEKTIILGKNSPIAKLLLNE